MSMPVHAAIVVTTVVTLGVGEGFCRNLLKNPGFEQTNDEGTFPLYWAKHHLYTGTYIVKTDAALAHRGSVCMGVHRAGPGAHKHVTALSYAGGRFRIAGNRDYHLSVWARGTGTLHVLCYLYSQHAFVGSIASPALEVTPKWQQYVFKPTMPEQGKIKKGKVVRFAVAFHVQGGPVWLDDAELMTADAAARAAKAKPRSPAPEQTKMTPLMTLPLAAQAPTIDGKINPAEWAHAAAVTGFSELGGQLAGRQTTVYATFDAKRLYFAFDSTYEGMLRQGERGHDTKFSHRIDEIEIWIQPKGKRWYQFVGTPAGGILDLSADAGRRWQGAWQFANHVTAGELLVGGRWQAEVAIAFAELGVSAPADGDVWRMNFCRDWSVTTQDRRPRDWTSWSFTRGRFSDPNRFGFARFDRAAPGVQIRSLGDLTNGQVGLVGQVSSPTPATVDIEAVVTADKDGQKPVVVRRQSVRVGAGKPSPVALDGALKVSGKTTMHLSVTAHAPGRPEPLGAADATFVCMTSLRLRLVPLFVRGLLYTELDVSRVPDLPKGFGATVTITRAGQHTPTLSTPVTGLSLDQPAGTVRFDVSKLPPGPYVVKVALADTQGKPLASTTEPITVPGRPKWLGNTIGLTDKVPPPWTPVAAGPSEVRITERTYQLGAHGWPVAVTSQDHPIFAGPVVLEAVAGGTPVRWNLRALQPRGATPRHATWAIAGTGGTLQLAGTLRVEFDGFALWDVQVKPTGSVRLDSLALELPFRSDAALYARASKGLESKFCSALLDPVRPKRELFASGLWHYSPNGWIWPDEFFFDLWVGNNERGFSVMCETDQYLVGKRRIEFVRRGAVTTLRVHLVSEPVELTSPLHYRYAWQATPVKPEPKDPKRWRSTYTGSRVDPELLKRVYVGCSYHRLKWVSYPVLRNPALTRRRTKHFHKYGAKIVPDYYLSAVSRDVPEFALYGREWEKIPRGGWSAMTGNACYACSRSSYGDFLLDAVRRVVEQCGLDGIYVDVSGPVACANAYHGCGYVPRGGTERRPTMNLFKQRDLFMRLYTYLHTGGRDGVIFSHTMHQAAIAGFLDVVTQGEEWCTEREKQYTRLTPDLFRAKEMKTQFGTPLTWYVFHYYTWRAKAYGKPIPLSEILMMCLPHRVLPTVSEPELHPIWDLVDPWWTRSTFVAYWADPPPATVSSTDVLVSAYVKSAEQRSLVVVSNWAYRDVDATVSLDLARVAPGASTVRLTDARTGKPVPHDGPRVRLKLPARNYRLLRVDSGP